jgi:hypothetical protein
VSSGLGGGGGWFELCSLFRVPLRELGLGDVQVEGSRVGVDGDLVSRLDQGQRPSHRGFGGDLSDGEAFQAEA